MKKTQVVIASTLKPVDDPRAYKRFALSMAKTNKYAINIIGFGTKNKSGNQDIIFHPMGQFNRLSLKRLLVKWVILLKLIKLKPDILIIQTHELILPSLLFKIFHPGKIIYDVRENYYRNLVYQNVFPLIIKHILASWIRLKELLSRYIFDAFILAETGYQKEFKFHLSKTHQIIENKVQLPNDISVAKDNEFGFIFTGNLSPNSGVISAINLFQEIHQIMPDSKLKVIGYSPSLTFLKKLKFIIKDSSEIELIGGDKLVPHDRILSEISKSKIGLVTYNVNPSNENCIPTKVYEYLALDLPFLSEEKTNWTQYASISNHVIPVNFQSYDASILVNQIKNIQATTDQHDIHQFTWESEEAKLISLLQQIYP